MKNSGILAYLSMSQKRRLPEVVLLSYTQNPVDVIYSAMRQCYSKDFAGDVFEAKDVSSEEKERLIHYVLSCGHESPLEHVNFTFAIEGISRVCSHQLVRHRLASYSQQSQRYVQLDEFEAIIPPSIYQIEEARKLFLDLMDKVKDTYKKLSSILESSASGDIKKAIEDARYVLPGACETKIVVTMNARELLHFFSLRLCLRAQWEIRALAEEMLSLVKSILPSVFEGAGPKCVRLGYCPEGKFSCGKYPTREEVFRDGR